MTPKYLNRTKATDFRMVKAALVPGNATILREYTKKINFKIHQQQMKTQQAIKDWIECIERSSTVTKGWKWITHLGIITHQRASELHSKELAKLRPRTSRTPAPTNKPSVIHLSSHVLTKGQTDLELGLDFAVPSKAVPR